MIVCKKGQKVQKRRIVSICSEQSSALPNISQSLTPQQQKQQGPSDCVWAVVSFFSVSKIVCFFFILIRLRAIVCVSVSLRLRYLTNNNRNTHTLNCSVITLTAIKQLKASEFSNEVSVS